MFVRIALALATSIALASGALTPAYAQSQPAAPQAQAAPLADLVAAIDIPYEEFTLANGLRVIVHTDRKAPIVGTSIWYDVGSKHEPKGKTGFAHLFEHLMFNGSENAPGDFFEPLRSIGATDLNGTTNFDRTNYFQTVPKAALDRLLFLESDRMGYLLGAVTQEVLDEQRGVVQNEKRQNDNRPYGLLNYSLLEGLFGQGHPYSHSPIGSMDDLQAASLEDVKTWFRSYYGPNNAVLVLAGDIDAREARPLVEKYFGKIPKGPETVTPPINIPTLSAPKTDVLKDQVAATLVYRAWTTPGLNDPESQPLEVAAGVLGGLASSRLDRILVREEKLAVQVSTNLQSLANGGIFGIQAIVPPGGDVAKVNARIDQILADFIAKGPTADEVARYTTNTVAGRLSGLEAVGGFGGKAVTLASGALYSDNPAFYKTQLERLAKVTPAQVQAATKKWLTRPAYTAIVEPGQREAYQEAQATAAAGGGAAPATTPGATKPTPANATGPVQGTRGGLPDVGEVRDIDFPEVTRSKLANGVELIYAQRDAVPITQIVVSFDAGQVADPADKLGTQSLMLQVMDEGTRTLDANALAEARERLGARIGGGSSADRTFLSLYTPSANLAPSSALLADVTRNPAFAAGEVDRVRVQLLTTIQQELQDPNGLASRAVPRVLYPANSPYAKLAAQAGDPAVVAKLTRDDLVAFHQAWIRPEKAKIFVVSDRPLAEVRAALNASFGDWQATGTAGTKQFGPLTQASQPKIVLIDRPNSPQSVIVGAQMTGLEPKGELLAELTANEVLGSGFLSRINMDLREAKGWSYGARGGFTRLENAVSYVISAPVQADKTGEAIASTQQQVGQFLSTNGVTQVEFDRTVTGNIRGLAGNFETAGNVLSAMQANDLYGRPDDYQDTIAQKYRALNAGQLDAAARGALDPKNFVWVVVGDAKTVRPQLDSLGLPVEVMSLTPAASAPAAAAAGAE
jgi:zinc protease